MGGTERCREMRAGGIAARRRDGGDIALAVLDHRAGAAHPFGGQDEAQRGSLFGEAAAKGGATDAQQAGDILTAPRVHRRQRYVVTGWIAEGLAMARLIRSKVSAMIAQFGIMIERFGSFSAQARWHLDAADRA